MRVGKENNFLKLSLFGIFLILILPSINAVLPTGGWCKSNFWGVSYTCFTKDYCGDSNGNLDFSCEPYSGVNTFCGDRTTSIFPNTQQGQCAPVDHTQAHCEAGGGVWHSGTGSVNAITDSFFEQPEGGCCSIGILKGTKEICNGLDDDCNGQIDDISIVFDSCPTLTYYLDNDGDTYFGNNANSCSTFNCANLPGRSPTPGNDCNDENFNINPGATAICDNNLDDNCNGQVDENCGPATLCSECGAGFANSCTDSECTSIVEGCFYNYAQSDCFTCDSSVQCSDFEGDQTSCEAGACGNDCWYDGQNDLCRDAKELINSTTCSSLTTEQECSASGVGIYNLGTSRYEAGNKGLSLCTREARGTGCSWSGSSCEQVIQYTYDSNTCDPTLTAGGSSSCTFKEVLSPPEGCDTGGEFFTIEYQNTDSNVPGCTQESRTVFCPSSLRLPFFSWFNILITILGITSIYFLVSLRRKE